MLLVIKFIPTRPSSAVLDTSDITPLNDQLPISSHFCTICHTWTPCRNRTALHSQTILTMQVCSISRESDASARACSLLWYRHWLCYYYHSCCFLCYVCFYFSPWCYHTCCSCVNAIVVAAAGFCVMMLFYVWCWMLVAANITSPRS